MTRARHRSLLPALLLLTGCAGTRVTRDETVVMRLPRVAHECHPAPRFAVGGALLREGERTLLVRLERAQTCTTVRGEDQLVDVDVTEAPRGEVHAAEIAGAAVGLVFCAYGSAEDCDDGDCRWLFVARFVGCGAAIGLTIASIVDARPAKRKRVHERRTTWGETTHASGANVPAAGESIGVLGPWGRIDATTDARGAARVELPETVDASALVSVEVIGEGGERATLRVRRTTPDGPDSTPSGTSQGRHPPRHP